MQKRDNVFLRRLFDSITVIWVALTMCPLLWVISTATKNAKDAYAIPPKWIYMPIIDNFKTVLSNNLFVNGFKNSLIIAVCTTSLSLVFGISSGYSLARNKSRSSQLMALWIILTRMLPAMGFAIPFYFIFRSIGISDTYLAVVLTYMTSVLPLTVWLMMGFIKGVPLELEEAAMIDGCSRAGTLLRIVVPVVRPGIATCAIFAFMQAWNEFFYAVIITGKSTRTASVAIQSFVDETGTNWGLLCAAALLVALPMIIFTLISQKSLIRGLTSGAVKG